MVDFVKEAENAVNLFYGQIKTLEKNIALTKNQIKEHENNNTLKDVEKKTRINKTIEASFQPVFNDTMKYGYNAEKAVDAAIGDLKTVFNAQCNFTESLIKKAEEKGYSIEDLKSIQKGTIEGGIKTVAEVTGVLSKLLDNIKKLNNEMVEKSKEIFKKYSI